MNIAKQPGKFEILGILGEEARDRCAPLRLIELAGRTAYRSADRITGRSCRAFVKMLISRGHESVLEHSALTVRFSGVSRGFTHELVRHRLATFTQESTRYVDQSGFAMVLPPAPGGRGVGERELREMGEGYERNYRRLRAAGWAPQDARQFLPIGIVTTIVVTANFREWRNIFRLRAARAAHWEIRGVMTELLRAVKRRVPVVFADLRPGQ